MMGHDENAPASPAPVPPQLSAIAGLDANGMPCVIVQGVNGPLVVQIVCNPFAARSLSRAIAEAATEADRKLIIPHPNGAPPTT